MTTVIVDAHWRRMDELFSPSSLERLSQYDIVWGRDEPIPHDVLWDALPKADVLIAANPVVSSETLGVAPNLKAVIEVSGAFPDTIDYAACANRGVEVLSCAPGFRSAVAEMGLAMALGATRGLVREHEAFRTGNERWLEDCAETDFTLFGARIGFVGFGQIAQETAKVMAPFAPEIRAFDPWLPEPVAQALGARLTDLEDLARWAQVLFVTAAPTAENRGLIGAEVLSHMPDRAHLVILSRAHLVDFEAVVAEAVSGRISVATDVYPSEPLAADHPLRTLPNVILSPHRAAAVPGGRQLIGEMICDDLDAMLAGDATRRLAKANAATIDSLAGVGDADKVGAMAVNRT